MIMPPARRMADRERTRAAVGARYAALARAGQAGQVVTDGDPAGFFTAVTLTPVHPLTGGVHSAIIRAARP
jgi:hypothetical protein